MIIPAIFEKDFEEIENKIKQIEEVTKRIQIDVADGKLVNGVTFLDIHKLDEIQTNITFELDLMVENPLDYLDTKMEKVDKVCINIVAVATVPEALLRAKELGYIIGVSVNPTTPLDLIMPLIDQIDFIQFMGVLPGGQGRLFDESVIGNIQGFKEINQEKKIQIDGGLNEDTLPLLKGLNIKNYVIGSALFTSDNPIQTYHTLNNIVINL